MGKRRMKYKPQKCANEVYKLHKCASWQYKRSGHARDFQRTSIDAPMDYGRRNKNISHCAEDHEAHADTRLCSLECVKLS